MTGPIPDPTATVDALARGILDDGMVFDRPFTLDLPFGSSLSVTWEHDPYMSVLDESGPDMWCGSLAWVEHDRDTGHRIRPDGFTGAAEILPDGCSRDAIWWEPPADARAPGNLRDSIRRNVLDLLEYGYYTLELTYNAPDGRPLRSAYLGGIEPDPDSMSVRDFLSDLYAEVCGR